MNTRSLYKVLSLILLFAVLLAACTATPTPTAEVTEPEEAESMETGALAAADITVAGVVFQDDQFMKSMVQGFQDAGKKLGVKQVIIGNSSNDQAKETELINTYMSQGVNGIAIAPLSPTVSIEALKQANDKGVAVALTNSGGFTDVAFITGGYMSDNTANGTAMSAMPLSNTSRITVLTGTIQVGIIDYDHQKPEESNCAMVDLKLL